MNNIEFKNWSEFKDSGMLWFVNRILHVFGWAIVYTYNEDHSISEVAPARVKFRGFNYDTEDEGFKNVSKYMHENSKDLLEESKES